MKRIYSIVSLVVIAGVAAAQGGHDGGGGRILVGFGSESHGSRVLRGGVVSHGRKMLNGGIDGTFYVHPTLLGVKGGGGVHGGGFCAVTLGVDGTFRGQHSFADGGGGMHGGGRKKAGRVMLAGGVDGTFHPLIG